MYRFVSLDTPHTAAHTLFQWLSETAGWELVIGILDPGGANTEVTDWGDVDADDLDMVAAWGIYKFPHTALVSTEVRLVVMYMPYSIGIAVVQAQTDPAGIPSVLETGEPSLSLVEADFKSVNLAVGTQLIVHTTDASITLVTMQDLDVNDFAWTGYLETAARSMSNPTAALGSGVDPFPAAWIGAAVSDGDSLTGTVVADDYVNTHGVVLTLPGRTSGGLPMIAPVSWRGAVPLRILTPVTCMEFTDEAETTGQPRGYLRGVYFTSTETPLSVLQDASTRQSYLVLGSTAEDSDASLALGPL